MKTTLLITIAALAAAVALAPGQAPAQSSTHTVTLAAAPTIITFGGTTVLTGQLVGADNAGVKVDLQQDAFPFGDPKNAGVSAQTDANGNYTMSVKPELLTRYQVTAKAKPQVSSPSVDVRVRPLLAIAVNDARARRGQRITFSGTVTPAHSGTVSLQRRIGTGSFKTIARPTLVNANGAASFVHNLRVRRTATYRFRIAADSDHARGTSPKRRVRVR